MVAQLFTSTFISFLLWNLWIWFVIFASVTHCTENTLNKLTDRKICCFCDLNGSDGGSDKPGESGPEHPSTGGFCPTTRVKLYTSERAGTDIKRVLGFSHALLSLFPTTADRFSSPEIIGASRFWLTCRTRPESLLRIVSVTAEWNHDKLPADVFSALTCHYEVNTDCAV